MAEPLPAELNASADLGALVPRADLPVPASLSARPAAAAEDAWLTLLKSARRCQGGRLAYFAVFKRCLDIVVGGLALVLIWPLLLLTALVIRLTSRGPALFRQSRIGRGGEPFVVYKFRTMTWEPHQELRLFMGADGRLRHKVNGDPRVTRVGKVLRRTSIDEWPQFVNVVRGNMSLVGPRPELPQIVMRYEPWQHQRHLVRPGMTGWWQVQGRGDLPMHEHTDLDLYYVKHLSFRLDMRIAARTVRVVLRGFGAF
ncbi:MAG: sugar transferase [Thermomicrobiales bacterium]